MAEMKPKYPAKIERPTFKNALKRKRLFSLFDEDSSHSLIWICGPAGYGKTTLISSYIEHKNIPCIWYQWDASDTDPASLYYYLGQACLKETPDKKTSIPSYAPEYESDSDTFSLRFFENIFESIDPPALIVFDNLIKKPEQYFVNILLNVLSRIPSGVRIAIVSRSKPPPALAVFNMQNKMKVIGMDELRLDLGEFKNAAKLCGIDDVSDDTLIRIHQKVEGWIAGLMLMAESYRRSGLDLTKVTGSNIQEIYEFFTGEIDRSLGDKTKKFLIKVSFLPHVTINTAEILTGFNRCEYILNYLTSHNLFTARRESVPEIYQFHSLFKAFLQKRAHEILSPDELVSTKLSAAKILKDTGQYESAATLFIELKLWKDLTSLIIDNVYIMVANGRHHQLLEWILSMPEDIYSKDQGLQYWLGICKFPFSPGESRPYFVKSMNIALTVDDAVTAYRSWAAGVESVAFEFNDLNELDSLIDIFDSLHMEFPEYPSKEIEGTVAIAMLIALVFRNPGHPMIDDWARRAVSLAMSYGQFNDKIRVALIEGMRLYYMGNMVEMKVTIEALVEPYEIDDVWLSMRPLVYYLSSFKEWVFANIAYCRELVEEGLKIADSTGVHIWDSLLLGQGAMCALSDNDLELTRKYIDRMSKRLPKSSRLDNSHYHYLLAWMAHLMGDSGLAISHAQKGYDLKVELGYPFGTGANGLALAEAQWAGGDRKKAAKLLAESQKIARETKCGLLSFLCDMTETIFALEEGNKDKAVEYLRNAFTLGSARNIYNFIWFRKEIMNRLCSLAIENGITISYTQELIDRHNLVPDSLAEDLEDWPWPVKLYTLGRFELIVKGKKVKFAKKSQEKPMSLLMAVAAFGGRDIDSWRLVEALWPDSHGAAGQQALATTLFRLRKIIGIDDAVIFSKGTITLNPEIFWVDIWALERAMGSISPFLEEGPAKKESIVKMTPQIETALSLYKGHFLSHDGTYSWCITPRERLRSKYIRNLTNFCIHLEKHGENRKAVHWYQKALELEDLAEELYQGLIKNYHQLGMKAEAISTYNRCRRVLSDVLGVQPSKETERIREAVLKG